MGDDYFLAAVLLSLPAANLYPLLYAVRVRWWRDWIGFALLVKATGLAIMLDFTAFYLTLGDYPAREVFRTVGITLVCVGVWLAFLAMLRAWRRKRA